MRPTLTFGAAAICYAAVHFLATRQIYFPTRYPEGWWEQRGSLGAEDVWLHASDGVKLHAWWVPSGSAGLATLYLHGNGGNLSHRADHAREIAAAGSSVLLLDYRGYGRSAGFPTERGLYRDADAGYAWLRKRGYRPEQIVIQGESLGTTVAVDLAVRHRPAGVVLEAPFTSASEMASQVVPVLGPLLIWGYNAHARIPRLRAPLLAIHGDRDDIVPLAIGRRLFAAAPEPKTFWVVPGAGHNDLLQTAGPAYREHLRAFYATLSGGQW